jgi:hypothetical protein
MSDSQKHQLLFWNILLSTLDKWLNTKKIEQFARLAYSQNLPEIAMPMFYKVWMFCLTGKMYLRVGQYEKARVQFQSALLVWEGSQGYEAVDWTGNEGAKAKHDYMIGKGLHLSDLGE